MELRPRTILIPILLASLSIADTHGAPKPRTLRGLCITPIQKLLAARVQQPHLIPEILQLEGGQAVPPRVFETHDPADIARSLVERVRLKNNPRIPAAKPDVNWAKNGRVLVFFKPEKLSDVLHQGLLNQHQTRASNGLLDLSRRRDLESTLLQVELPVRSPGVESVRPKYGLLVARELKDQLIEIEQYGPIATVLKSDVHDRVTWTHTDSLELQHYNSRSEFLPKTLEVPYSREQFGPLGQSYDFTADAYGWTPGYAEAQIWGPVAPQDIEGFLVPKGTDPKLIAEIKQHGFSVFPYLKTATDPMDRSTRVGILLDALPQTKKATYRIPRQASAKGAAPQQPIPYVWKNGTRISQSFDSIDGVIEYLDLARSANRTRDIENTLKHPLLSSTPKGREYIQKLIQAGEREQVVRYALSQSHWQSRPEAPQLLERIIQDAKKASDLDTLTYIRRMLAGSPWKTSKDIQRLKKAVQEATLY